ncbi:MAG: BPSS1780 family membrane protein [Casimicrobiaceae bacterium]
MKDVPSDFLFTRYDARQGSVWLRRAFAMFMRARLSWTVLLLAYFVLMILVRLVPFLGPVLLSIAKPIFAVGLLAAAWTQERGGTPSFGQLFQGFRANLVALLPIGVFFLVGATIAMYGSALVDGGKLVAFVTSDARMSDEEIAAAFADSVLQRGLLFSALLMTPVLMATWWAPALVVFQDAKPGAALAASLKASLANWKPLIAYALTVFLFGGVLPGLFLGVVILILPPPVATVLVPALLLPYLLFFTATLHISDFVSYRDVFHAGETLTPLTSRSAATDAAP